MEFYSIGTDDNRFPNSKIEFKAVDTANSNADLPQDTFYELIMPEPVVLF